MERAPWLPAQEVRALPGGVAITTGDPHAPAVAWVEHQRFPDLAFRVEFDRAGRVVGAQVRPMLFKLLRSRRDDGWTFDLLAIDEDSIGEDGRDLTARLLGDLPWGAVFRQAQGALRQSFKWLPSDDPEWAQILRRTYRTGSRGRPDSFYALLAADYLAAIDAGETAKAFAKARSYAPSTINNLLGEAQRRGILARRRGQAGGHLLEYGKSLLVEMEDK